MHAGNPVVLIGLSSGETLNDGNYARQAEMIMNKYWNKGFKNLTTSKIRSIYALIMNLYTRIDGEESFQKHRSDIQYLKVRMAYEAGREDSVKSFLDETSLGKAVDNISDYDTFVLYCRYAESLVAYFKFFGGRD